MFKINKIRDENIKNQNLNEQLLNKIKKTITLLENIFLYGVFPSSFFILLIQISASKSFKSNLFKLLIDDADAIVDEVTVETDDHTNSLDRKHVDLIEGKSRSDTPINNNLPEDEIKNKRYWDWDIFNPNLLYIGFAAVTVLALLNAGCIIQLVSEMKSAHNSLNDINQHGATMKNFLEASIKLLNHINQNSGNSGRDNNNE